MSFRTKIQRWAGISYADLCNIFSWLDLNRSSVEFNNPNLLVASATNERGETVCYTTAEPIFLVNAYAVSPSNTPEEAQKAGDSLDLALADASRKANVGRMLIVVPADAPSQPGERYLRVVERKVQPQPFTTNQRIGCLDSPTRFFLN